MRPWDRFITAAFLIGIMLPGAATLAGVDGGGDTENRELAPWPLLRTDGESLRTLPDAFTRYFEDHFAFRSSLVTAQSWLRLEVLKTPAEPTVIRGREGWLFYADDGAIEDYAVATTVSPSDLEAFRDTLQRTQDWLNGRGIAYAFLIAPDKHVVYPEMMPATLRPFSSTTRIDQLVAYLRQHSTVNVVDVRAALVDAKSRERVYHRTDTHWNDRGAHIAYERIMAAVGLRAFPREDYTAEARTVPGMDLAWMLNLTGRLTEEDLALVPRQPRQARTVIPANVQPHGQYARVVTEHPDSTLPRAVVYRDSFATGLIPFLSEHFSRAVYLWERDLDPAVIEAERPQVVIQEWVGRRIGVYTPYDPFQQ